MICIPILAKTTGEACTKIVKANPMADILELRLDLMESCCLEDLIQEAAKPLIVTYRSQREGGSGSADYETIARYLSHGIEKGADFIDVEYRMPGTIRRGFLERRAPCGVIVSAHLLDGTPSSRRLDYIFKSLASTGADIVKLVTRASSPEDNLRVLELIPVAQTEGVNIIALCTGPMGRLSRIASPLLGGYLTFASLEQGQESADGQLSVMQMRDILQALNG
jgi:3-dehydroquinate dehydratase type I